MMDIDFSEYTEDQLRSFSARAMAEILARSVRRADPETLLTLADQKAFNMMGDPRSPFEIAPGIIAVPGNVVDTSASKHTCNLSTICLPDDSEEVWSWNEEIQTFIIGDTSKVGKVRRSVNLQVAIDGLRINQHVMNWNGEMHIRKACKSFVVRQDYSEETGLITTSITLDPSWNPGSLPRSHNSVNDEKM